MLVVSLHTIQNTDLCMHHFKDQSLWFVQNHHAFCVMIAVWKIGLLLSWSIYLRHNTLPFFLALIWLGIITYILSLCVHSLPQILLNKDWWAWVLVLNHSSSAFSYLYLSTHFVFVEEHNSAILDVFRQSKLLGINVRKRHTSIS